MEKFKNFPWVLTTLLLLVLYLVLIKPLTQGSAFANSPTNPKRGEGVWQIFTDKADPIPAHPDNQPSLLSATTRGCQCTCTSRYVGTVCVPKGQVEYSETGWSTKCVCEGTIGRMVFK